MAKDPYGTLSPIQHKYIDWLCTAPDMRKPSSKLQFANENEITDQTLRNWEKHPVFREHWETRMKGIEGAPEKAYLLLEAIYGRAMKGDLKAAETWLKAMGKMNPPKIEVETTVKAARELSDDELQALIAQQASVALAARENDDVFGVAS